MNSTDPLREFIGLIPTLAWSAAPDGFAESFNRVWLDYTRLIEEAARGRGWKMPLEVKGRLRRFDGEFRRFLFRGTAVRDAAGKIIKW